METDRQLEVWRRAARHAARDARAEPLGGAIAILGASANPWQWGWRDLVTGASIRLPGLFAPLPESAFPPGVMAHLAAVQDLAHACDLADPSRLAGAQARPADLPAVTTVRDRALLTLLARAPQMRASEIAAVSRALSARPEPLDEATVERRLRDLARLGLVERRLSSPGPESAWRWQLAERGWRHVAAMHDAPIRHFQRVTRRASAAPHDSCVPHAAPPPFEPRDEFVMQRQAAHLAGVYGVVAAFHRAAQATRGAISVPWWETGRGCERTFLYHGIQRNLRPDAELDLAYAVQGTPRHLRLWLEYDRGTMNQHDLAGKMGAYRDYWESREWAADGYAMLPRLLFIVPEAGQEERVRQACAAELAPAPVRVQVTTAAHLEQVTPLGRVWRQVWPIVRERETRRALWE